MKKVAALTWSPSGKKLAVGAADRVNIYSYSQSIYLIKMELRKISSLQNHQIKDKNHI